MSTLYRRLLLWFCIANVATLLCSVAITEQLARRAYGTEPDWNGLAQAADAAYVEGGIRALREWHARQRFEGIDAWLFEDGRDLVGTQPLPHTLEVMLPQLLANPGMVLHPRAEEFVASERVVGSDGVARQFVALRAPRPHEHLHRLLAVQILMSLLVIGVLGWLLARGVSGPVRALTATTQRMTEGDLGARVDEKWTRGRDELARLAGAFNTMAARLDALIAHERGVLQDISHELRSPLARLQLHLELARRQAGGSAPQIDRAEGEIARLDRLLTEMLALTRLEAGLPGMTRERCDLAALARARLAEAAEDLAAAGLRAELQASAPVFVLGSPPLLDRALDNLIGNAIKYGRGEGPLEVGVAAIGDRAELRVRDHGPGVSDKDLASLFRPFYRGANAGGSEGQGLGLAVVARIAEAHRGEAVAAHAAGGGLEIRFRLPLADRA